MATFWVDGSIGASGDGQSIGTAKKTIAEGLLLITSVGDILNVVNSVTYAEASGTGLSLPTLSGGSNWTTDFSWKIRGVDGVNENPALVSLAFANDAVTEYQFALTTSDWWIVQGFSVDVSAHTTDHNGKHFMLRNTAAATNGVIQGCHFKQRTACGGAILANTNGLAGNIGEIRYNFLENKNDTAVGVQCDGQGTISVHHNVVTWSDGSRSSGSQFVDLDNDDNSNTNHSVYNNTLVVYATSNAPGTLFRSADAAPTAASNPTKAIHSNVIANFQASGNFRHAVGNTSNDQFALYNLTIGYTLFVNPNGNNWNGSGAAWGPWPRPFDPNGDVSSNDLWSTDVEIAIDPFVDKSTAYNWNAGGLGYLLPLPGDLHLTIFKTMALDGGPPGALDDISGTEDCTFSNIEIVDCVNGVELRSQNGQPARNNTLENIEMSLSADISDPANFEMVRLIDTTLNASEVPHSNTFVGCNLSSSSSQNVGRKARIEGHDNLFLNCNWATANVGSDADITIGHANLPSTAFVSNIFIGGAGLDDIVDTSTAKEFISEDGTGSQYNNKNVFLGSSLNWGATADAGSSLFRIDTTNNRVGVGTENPSCLFTVNGDLCTVNLYVSGTTSGITHIEDATDGDTYVRTEESTDEDVVRIGTAGVERLTVGATGVVTVNPGQTTTGDLVVASDNFANMLVVDASADSVGIGTVPSASFCFHVVGSQGSGVGPGGESMQFNTNGNARIYFGASDVGGDPNIEFDLSNQRASIRFEKGNVHLGTTTVNDNRLKLGTSDDGHIYYDGNDLVVDPRVVGSGDVLIPRDDTALALGAGGGGDARVYWDGTDLVIDPDALTSGTGDFLLNKDGTATANALALGAGVGGDARIYWSGSALTLDPKAAGTGTVTVGGGTLIDGAADEIQLTVKGHSTQTANFMEVITDGGTSLFEIQAGPAIVINEDSASVDVRMKSDSDANMFFLDSDRDAIGFGLQPAASAGKVQIELDTTADVPALFVRRNVAATATNGADIYAGIDIDVDYDYAGAAGTDLPTLIRGRLDLTHTSGASFTKGQLVDLRWNGDNGTAVGSDTTAPWHCLITTALGTNAPGTGYFRFKANNTGSPSSTQIALNSEMAAAGSGALIGYQGSAAPASGHTGNAVGVEGYVTAQTGTAYVHAVRGNAASATAITLDQRVALFATGGHIVASAASLWVTSTARLHAGAFSTTHLDNTAGGQGYFESDVEIDGKLWCDGDFEMTASGGAIGFFGATAAARTTAYTQTYSTATRTHSTPTGAALTDSSGGTPDQTVSAVSGTGDDSTINDNFAELVDEVNKLVTDLANAKQVLNQVIDDMQTYGLLQ